MIVAEITKDHLAHGERHTYDGKKFDSEALREWWGWGIREGWPEDTYFALAEANSGKLDFKLYDDDNELYYEGWLINDDEWIVQHFVLSWAERDSGCTIITVKVKGGNYIQQIG